jgi:trehalose 6-phosphate phosphatase
MKNILGRAELATLRDFARQRVLLAFDFDGTLAPIVRDPGAAAMRPRTAALLAETATRYPCVVISGRSRADVMKKVSHISLRAVIGNHGMEPARELRAARRLAALWHRQLESSLPRIPGVIIEDKGASLAIHYRRARSRGEVRRLVLVAVADLADARTVEGKMVMNVLPANAPNKGTAVVRLCKRLRCEATIYVGDDETTRTPSPWLARVACSASASAAHRARKPHTFCPARPISIGSWPGSSRFSVQEVRV